MRHGESAQNAAQRYEALGHVAGSVTISIFQERRGSPPRENIARQVARLLNLTDGAVCAYHTGRIMIEMEVAEW